MHFSYATFVAATTIIGLSKALPTLSSPDGRTSEQCPSQWYVCANNGFRGCCSVDPCALPACPDYTNGAPVSQPTSPDPPAPAAPAPAPVCTPGQTGQVKTPTLYSISSTSPDKIGEAIKDISFSQSAGPTNILQQVMTFSGIPSAAKACTFKWFTGPNAEFKVGTNGYAELTTLKGPLPEAVSWNSVKNLVGTRAGGPDFTGWPALEASTHTVGNVDCGSELVFKIGINGNEAGAVDLKQDAESGFSIDWQC